VPLYEYACKRCGTHFEKIEKVNGPHMRKCTKCGGKVEQQVSAPAIQFKGSGWYVTDYASKGGSAEATTAKDEKKDAKEAKETKETKAENSGSEKTIEKSTEKGTEKKQKGPDKKGS